MVKHYIDKENGVVVAVAEGCAADAINRILKRMQGNVSLGYNKDLFRTAVMDDRYVAVAKCHPNDVFDEAVGRKIADEKLQEKIARAREKAIKRWKKHHLALMDLV